MPTEDQNSERSHQGLPQGGVELSLDELAKGLATGTLSRGKAIRWMGGAILGAALASVPGVAWANDCRRLGRQCRRDSQCCSGNCIRQGDDKVCACPEGRTPCNDRCVNLDRNENHCGACFNRCPEDVECVGGVCQCPSGTTACGGNCVPNCQSGQALDPSTCQCVPQCGPGVVCDVSFTECAPLCACTDRLEGGTVCGQTVCGPPCTSSDECVQVFGPGAVCQAPGTGCCGQACIPACGATTAVTGISTGGSNVSSS